MAGGTAGRVAERRFDLPVPGGRVVRGLVAVPPGAGPLPAVVLAHGYSTHLDWAFWPAVVAALGAAGCASVRFNFSGQGIGPDLHTFSEPERFARNSYVDELDDLGAVLAFARAQPELDGDRLGLLGHSRGGAMGIVHAAERDAYRAVATWAAIDRILQFTPDRLEQWRRDGRIEVWHHAGRRRAVLDAAALAAAERARERLDVLAACRRLRAPLLVVMGDRDRALPFACAERLAAAAPAAELVRVEGGDHAFGARDPLGPVTPAPLARALAATTAHFRRWLLGGPAGGTAAGGRGRG